MDNFASVGKMLDRSLQERNRLFPVREERNDAEVKEALSEFVSLINEMRQQESFVPDPVHTEKAESVIERPVFLCGAMKSGTTLLLELLDGHPELIVLPGDSFVWGRLTKENPPSRKLLQADWDRWLKRMVNPTGQAPFWVFGTKVHPYFEFTQYLQYWYEQFPETWRSSELSVLLSFYCANPSRSSAPRMWVEKTPGNEFNLEVLLENFPDARFIHIVRDPRENLASLKKLYQTRSWRWDPLEVADRIAGSCRLADEYLKKLGQERYHLLTYEQLTERPAATMRELAEFIGIEWYNALLKPTVNSVPAHANSMYEDRQSTGVVRKMTGKKYHSVLTKQEQRIALGTLQDAKKVGYLWEKTLSDSAMLVFSNGWNRMKKIVFSNVR
ncbi:MAG: sulfotransferase [Candidatus Electrothrix communis]|nr:MAG: sulfotransferase [Candidatus Electrothrix communis]